ncbi:MAG: Mrp/NBP35 family ATP-binding protein [Desulfovibrio sp.]|nr:Mrp/NBP35 family ATP-binding protein [Desulfovibrio sp.]
MASCSSCPSGSSCSHSTTSGGDGNCNDPFAQQDKIIAQALKGIKHKIFVMSGKGGVGKSSVTVNLAAALAQNGRKVGIMDVDIHGPSVPNLLGLKSTIEVDPFDQMLLPAKYNENLSVISMDTLLEDRDQAILWRGPKKASAIRQFLADVKWGNLDYLIIDSPPGTGDEHMTVLKSIPDAKCVVVTTPQEISLADVRKAVNFLQYTNAEILGIVENMSGLACPNCGMEINLFKKGGGEELAKSHGLAFLGAIPLDPAAVVSADMGQPVVYLNENSPAKKAFLDLSAAIARAADSSIESLAN